jgi:ZIP family zinc transporter
MAEWFLSLDVIWQALIATIFTWAATAFGASFIFLFKEINRRVMDGMLGFAAGVMMAAVFWSLLNPAIEMSKGQSLPSWFPASVGFIAGMLVIAAIDRIVPHLHLDFPLVNAEGIKTKWRRSILFFLAITLHNFPEGLAIGVAFGAIHTGSAYIALPAVIALIIGLSLQNIPEGMAIAFPLRREGLSRFKSFFYGQLSGIVEPLGAVIGVLAIGMAHSILPYASGFAAGAMMFVIVEELIPESQHGEHPDIATLGTMLGFVAMMILDVAFS